MDKKTIKFDDTEIEEYEFHQYKSPILINEIEINKILIIILENKILIVSLVTKIIKK